MKGNLKPRIKSSFLMLMLMFLITAMLPETAFAAPKKVPAKAGVTKVSASADSVKVTWKKAKNADSYRIYYKPSTGKKWTAIKTVSSKTTGYTHKSSKKYPLKAGKKYYYTVRAYNKSSKKWGKYDTKGKYVTMQKSSHKHNFNIRKKEVSHMEYVTEKYTEKVPKYKWVAYDRCLKCRTEFGHDSGGIMDHIMDICGSNYETYEKKVRDGYKTVTKTRKVPKKVIDDPAHYECACGKRK